jgi:hypothetical protein
VVTETNQIVPSKTPSPRATMPWMDKLMIAGLLCLEIPFGIVFFPMAAVFVLTGILAPLGMASFALATMPFSLAMKHKSAWHAGNEATVKEGDTP